MRFAHRLAAVAALGTVAAGTPALAIQLPRELHGVPPVEVASGATPRAQRAITWGRAPEGARGAWRRFTDEVGPGWRAAWDTDTGVPSRLLGPGVAAPGSTASASRAEAFARAFLARHLDLLAPGASPGDFVVAGNDLDGGVRSIGFFQHRRGARVLGGQVSFRFRNDRLFLIGSEALPHVAVELPAVALGPEIARARATAWILGDRAAVAQAGAVEGPFVLPLVGAGRADHHAVVRVTVDARQPIGRWSVYLDAGTGAPVAREQTLRFADGTIRLDAPVRYPAAGRFDYPAQRAELTVGGAPLTSDDAGLVSWPDAAPVQVDVRLTGPLVRVLNDVGPEATTSFALDPGGAAVWSAPDAELVDAQLSAFVHTQVVKAHVRAIAPDLAWLDTRIDAVVNISDICNAYSDGDNIHFFQSGGGCENTARLADVVYHEFGHSLHAHAIIPGVGEFEGGLSEGISDYLAASITGDPGTSRGFFYSDEPLRHIDPAGEERVWPDDVSEIHETGLIIAGALWDLRKALAAKLGPEAGAAHTDRLFYQGIRRAVDIPSMYPEALAADDDDGDLTNGTPNACEIAAAFGLHGLRGLSAEVGELGVEPPTADGYRVSLRLEGLFAGCPGDGIQSATVAWKVRDETGKNGEVAMAAGPGGYEATIPAQAAGEVVQYRVLVQLESGVAIGFPDNPADPLYELFVGKTIPLYCTDFESDPAADGWTYPEAWQWNTPAGSPASGDPAAAFSGARVLGTDLGQPGDGLYAADNTSGALSPVIQTGGHRRVRLQYRRWLNVEDGNFDQATIYADGQRVWQNLDSGAGDFSSTHHRDKEWRFQDVDLSAFVADGAVQIGFEIQSDQGLELGGWTLDDLCVVALDAPGCGDGVLQDGEACDDGARNSDALPDACRSDCQAPHCGDGVVDAGETCDGGAGCDAVCGAPTDEAPALDEGGCACRAGGDPAPGDASPGGLAAAALGLATLAARRRRRRR